ncbi:MAG: PHP domain-containing protein [Planctomycetota bacterium]|nr:PHP domain-containing protein [Planctomycetota bacterium]
MKIDLHTHTTCSDGIQTPTELMTEAKEVGLDIIAVTDHDTTAGLDEAAEAAEQLGLRLIPGIELSVYAMEREVHVLAFFLDRTSPALQEFLQEQKEARVARIYKMLEKLKSIGVDIPPEDVIVEGKKGTLGRPHVARALVKHGYIKEEDEAFRKYIGRDQPGHVPRVKVSPSEGIARMKEAGAIPVLAHPGLYGREGLVDLMIVSGVMGIEAYHPDHSEGVARRFANLAADKGLLVTGGSDYHGRPRGKRFGLGAVPVPESILGPLEAAAGL